MLWGDDLIDGIIAESMNKVRRVEDILDGKDPLERIEERLDAALSRSRQLVPTPVQPDEMSSRDAAAFLGISVDRVVAPQLNA